jgi:hypothetical protein
MFLSENGYPLAVLMAMGGGAVPSMLTISRKQLECLFKQRRCWRDDLLPSAERVQSFTVVPELSWTLWYTNPIVREREPHNWLMTLKSCGKSRVLLSICKFFLSWLVTFPQDWLFPNHVATCSYMYSCYDKFKSNWCLLSAYVLLSRDRGKHVAAHQHAWRPDGWLWWIRNMSILINFPQNPSTWISAQSTLDDMHLQLNTGIIFPLLKLVVARHWKVAPHFQWSLARNEL